MSRKLSGPERAAVLLMNLGEEIAAKVLLNLDDREIQNIGNYISELGDVDLEPWILSIRISMTWCNRE